MKLEMLHSAMKAAIEALMMAICLLRIVTRGSLVVFLKPDNQAVIIQLVLVHVGEIKVSSRQWFPSTVSHPAYVSMSMFRLEVGIQY